MPREPDLALTWDPDPADVDALHELLSSFNAQATGIDDGRAFAVWLRDAAGQVAGGCCGWTWGGTCYVDTLFLPAPLRDRGLGSRIMAMVEATAGDRGCTQILLQTHDFQAPAFYERLGFARSGATPDYPRGHAHLTMVKPLPQAAATARRQLAQE